MSNLLHLCKIQCLHNTQGAMTHKACMPRCRANHLASVTNFPPSKVFVATVTTKPVRLLVSPHRPTCICHHFCKPKHTAIILPSSTNSICKESQDKVQNVSYAIAINNSNCFLYRPHGQRLHCTIGSAHTLLKRCDNQCAKGLDLHILALPCHT